jgi:hypothetical protein
MVELLPGGERNRITAERILRVLRRWFGLEQPLLEYIAQSARLLTFIASVDNEDASRATRRAWRLAKALQASAWRIAAAIRFRSFSPPSGGVQGGTPQLHARPSTSPS